MLLIVPNAVRADGDWRDAWLANYVDICPDLRTTAQTCVLCHDGPPALNAYGADMGSMNFAAIEGTDSDGDGVSNGQEILVDCTDPWDADSVPFEADSWGAVKVLFR
jgi:hypothetical protein